MSSLFCSCPDMQPRACLAQDRPAAQLADDDRALAALAVHLNIAAFVQHDGSAAYLQLVRPTATKQGLLAVRTAVACARWHD